MRTGARKQPVGTAERSGSHASRGREADPPDERRRIHFADADDASGGSGGRAASAPQIQRRRYSPLQPPLPLQELFPGLAATCAASTGTLQPPLPLQEFLPGPPSAVLHPPRPLHSFLPLQSCLAEAEAQLPSPLHAFFPSAPSPLQAFMPLQTCAPGFAAAFAFFAASSFSSAKALEPATIPATPAPITLLNSLRSMHFLLTKS